MAEQKRRRKSVIEAEVLEQAKLLAAQKQGNGQSPGNPSVKKIEAQIQDHNDRQQFRYYEALGDEMVEYFASAVPWWTNFNESGTGKVLPRGTVPTFERFAYSKGFSKFSLYDWTEKHPHFARCYAEAQELQKAFLMEGAAANAIPAQFAMFMLRCNHGMMEPKDHDNSGDNDDVTMTVHGKGQTSD